MNRTATSESFQLRRDLSFIAKAQEQLDAYERELNRLVEIAQQARSNDSPPDERKECLEKLNLHLGQAKGLAVGTKSFEDGNKKSSPWPVETRIENAGTKAQAIEAEMVNPEEQLRVLSVASLPHQPPKKETREPEKTAAPLNRSSTSPDIKRTLSILSFVSSKTSPGDQEVRRPRRRSMALPETIMESEDAPTESQTEMPKTTPAVPAHSKRFLIRSSTNPVPVDGSKPDHLLKRSSTDPKKTKVCIAKMFRGKSSKEETSRMAATSNKLEPPKHTLKTETKTKHSKHTMVRAVTNPVNTPTTLDHPLVHRCTSVPVRKDSSCATPLDYVVPTTNDKSINVIDSGSSEIAKLGVATPSEEDSKEKLVETSDPVVSLSSADPIKDEDFGSSLLESMTSMWKPTQHLNLAASFLSDSSLDSLAAQSAPIFSSKRLFSFDTEESSIAAESVMCPSSTPQTRETSRRHPIQMHLQSLASKKKTPVRGSAARSMHGSFTCKK